MKLNRYKNECIGCLYTKVHGFSTICLNCVANAKTVIYYPIKKYRGNSNDYMDKMWNWR